MAEDSERSILSDRTVSSAAPAQFDLREIFKPEINSAHSNSKAEKHAQSWTDKVFGTLQILKHDLGPTVDTLRHDASVVGHQGTLLAEGVLTGAVLNPINGTTELMNRILPTHVKELRLANQQEVDNSTAGKIGETAGSIADFAALSLATGGIAGVAGLTGVSADMLSLGAAGALSGAVFSPSDDTDSNVDFFKARAEGAAIGGISSLLGVASGSLLSGVAAPIENAVLRRTLAIGGGAILGGALAAGSTELTAFSFTGKSADLSDLFWSTGIGVLAGAVSGVPNSDVDIDQAAQREPLRSTFVDRPGEMPSGAVRTLGGNTVKRPLTRVSPRHSTKPDESDDSDGN
jgi:hypothetical protein